MNPGKHQSSKQRGQDLDWKVHDRAHLLFFTHTLCMNYVIAMFLLVSCVNTSNLLLYFARFGAQSTPKIVNKNLQQRTLPGFISIYLYQICKYSVLYLLNTIQMFVTFSPCTLVLFSDFSFPYTTFLDNMYLLVLFFV